MGIFNRTKKPADAKKAAVRAEDKKAVSVEEKVGASVSTGAVSSHTVVLNSPRVSEKAAILASKGTYVFNVPITAGKVEIRKAVEALYKVKVERVNTVRGIGKITRRGRTSGRRNNWKKALVTLKSGQKIDLYQGV